MRNRAVPFAALEKKVAEIVMRRVVVSGNRKERGSRVSRCFSIRRLHKRRQLNAMTITAAMAVRMACSYGLGSLAEPLRRRVACARTPRDPRVAAARRGIRSRAKAARHYERHQVRDAPNNHQI